VLACIFCSCQTTSKKTNPKTITTQDQKFIDPDGRQIFLHGINVVNKNPNVNYLGDEGPDVFAEMKAWGFNCVRLGIIWDGLEPKPGVYDEQYLKGIDLRIQWAKENGLYVLLDMHQDLYSVLYSDGAPEWATLSGSHEFEKGAAVWSDAYFTSQAVQTAWDNFWANAPAPDGIGIQDHYAKAWQHVAKRYANEPMVVGFDIMNEPFLGSEAAHIFPLMLSKGAEILANIPGFGSPSVEELAYKWTTHEGRFEILEILSDVNLYQQVVDAPAELYQEFEQTKLMDMYQRVAKEIRQVDKNHILFLGTTMGSNMGVFSAIRPLVDENGNRDPLQAYAPHGYDLVTDTKFVASPNFDRIKFIFDRHNETAQRLNMPVLVGEWGAYGNHKKTFAAAQNVSQQFETHGFGDTYWDHDHGMESYDHFPAISRPYASRIAGTLKGQFFDPESKTFKCEWTEDKDVSAPTTIYIPAWMNPENIKVELTPTADDFKVEAIAQNAKNLLISPSGKSIDRSLVIQFK
jgi:endoglycosylceramidase